MSSDYLAGPFTSSHFRELLDDFDAKLILDSPNEEYRFEYYTVCVKDAENPQGIKIRKYRLLDRVRGTVTPEPWDAFDVERHAEILRGLTAWSEYRLKVSRGWEVTCTSCGHLMTGKTWQVAPKTCASKNRPKCKQPVKDADVVDLYSALPRLSGSVDAVLLDLQHQEVEAPSLE